MSHEPTGKDHRLMISRVALAGLVGVVMGITLTRVILFNEFIRIWLINVPSLLVWGAAFATGVIVAAITPYTFEFSVPPVSVFAGSLIGIIAFGTGLNISLADQPTLTYILSAFLISGLSLIVLAALGGWLVAAIRSRTESNTPYESRSGGR